MSYLAVVAVVGLVIAIHEWGHLLAVRIRAPLTGRVGFMLALMVYANIHDLGRIGLDVLS